MPTLAIESRRNMHSIPSKLCMAIANLENCHNMGWVKFQGTLVSLHFIGNLPQVI